MGRTFNNKNENILGIETFDFVKDRKLFNVSGSDTDDILALYDLAKKQWDDPGNIDIYFDGGVGDDWLVYAQSAVPIQLTALGDHSEWDFYVTGGYGKVTGGYDPTTHVSFFGDAPPVYSETGHQLTSLEVWCKSVEMISATGLDDVINLSASGTAFAVSGEGGDDEIQGSRSHDTLVGGSGNDTIMGHAGQDLIVGDEGDDVLYGGSQADWFVFHPSDGDDVIMDLSTEDRIITPGIEDGGTAFFRFSNGVSSLEFEGTSIKLDGLGHVTWNDFAWVTNDSGEIGRVLQWLGTSQSPAAPAPRQTLNQLETAQYIASHPDLIAAFGTNLDAGWNHYFSNGIAEGREITFKSEQYLANYTDLQNAFGDNLMAATQHFITHGFREGRTDNVNITNNLLSASVSSQWDGNHGIDKVLDGDDKTFNHTAAGDNAASMTFEFGQEFSLDEINIVNRHDGDISHQTIVGNRLTGATVEAYDDGALVWSGALTAATHQDLHLGGVVADSVVINGASNQYLHIAEVDIWSDHVF